MVSESRLIEAIDRRSAGGGVPADSFIAPAMTAVEGFLFIGVRRVQVLSVVRVVQTVDRLFGSQSRTPRTGSGTAASGRKISKTSVSSLFSLSQIPCLLIASSNNLVEFD